MNLSGQRFLKRIFTMLYVCVVLISVSLVFLSFPIPDEPEKVPTFENS